MSDVAFLQFLKRYDTPGDVFKDLCKRTVVGGASITAAVLEGALGRPLLNGRRDRSLTNADFDIGRAKMCISRTMLPDGRLMPTCAYNVVHRGGERITH